jgi:hypothetical protein
MITSNTKLLCHRINEVSQTNFKTFSINHFTSSSYCSCGRCIYLSRSFKHFVFLVSKSSRRICLEAKSKKPKKSYRVWSSSPVMTDLLLFSACHWCDLQATISWKIAGRITVDLQKNKRTCGVSSTWFECKATWFFNPGKLFNLKLRLRPFHRLSIYFDWLWLWWENFPRITK